MNTLHLFPVNGFVNFNRGNIAWVDALCQYETININLAPDTNDPDADDVPGFECLIEYVIFEGIYFTRTQCVAMFGREQVEDAEARFAEDGICLVGGSFLDWEYTCVLTLPEGVKPPLTAEQEWKAMNRVVEKRSAEVVAGRRSTPFWIADNFEREMAMGAGVST